MYCLCVGGTVNSRKAGPGDMTFCMHAEHAQQLVEKLLKKFCVCSPDNLPVNREYEPRLLTYTS